MRAHRLRPFLSSLLLVLVAATASAQQAPIKDMPQPLREVGFEQKLGETVPADLTFTNSEGEQVRLGDYFGEKPVVLALVYYECPMLCDMVLSGLISSLDILTFDAGNQYEVVVISFDPGETTELAAVTKKKYVDRYGREGSEDGFHFLVGDPGPIDAVTDAVGFSYAYDEDEDEYAHAAGITVLTPERQISRYLFGIEYAPKDLRLALVESSENKVGSVVDQLLLYCYAYDPETGSYGAQTMVILRFGGLLTIGALLAFIFLSRRRDRRRTNDSTEDLAQS